MPYPLTIFGNPRYRSPHVAARLVRVGRVYKTRFPEFGIQEQGRGNWRYVDLSTDQPVGPSHHSRVEAFADLERYAREYGVNPRRRRGRYRRNPETLPTLHAVQQSERVYEVKYRHVVDGEDYVHKFRAGVCMELLADGSVRLYRNDGRPLFRNFPDD